MAALPPAPRPARAGQMVWQAPAPRSRARSWPTRVRSLVEWPGEAATGLLDNARCLKLQSARPRVARSRAAPAQLPRLNARSWPDGANWRTPPVEEVSDAAYGTLRKGLMLRAAKAYPSLALAST